MEKHTSYTSPEQPRKDPNMLNALSLAAGIMIRQYDPMLGMRAKFVSSQNIGTRNQGI